MHAAHGQGEPLGHHLAPKRENTSSSSSTFCWRSDLEPERRASATQDSMCRPSRSFWTCSSAPCTAEICSSTSDAVRVAVDHPPQPLHLPLDATQPPPGLAPGLPRPAPLYPQGVVSHAPPGACQTHRLAGRHLDLDRANGWALGRGARAAAGSVALLASGGDGALAGGGRAWKLPALLLGDALALLDHQQIHESSERVA